MLGRTPAESHRLRRLGGFVVLVVMVLLVSHWLKGSMPREHAVVFRLPAETVGVVTRLSASFTPVGEAEAAHGLDIALHPPVPRNIHEKVRLPDGDYIVLLELTYGDLTGPSAPKKSETSRPRRVSLAGDQTLVVFEAEGSE
ncbi:MAG: hypothetical protein QM756_10430 [Polyangiaceae bacterium]